LVLGAALGGHQEDINRFAMATEDGGPPEQCYNLKTLARIMARAGAVPAA
jgi:hypothetical protein